MAGPAEFKLVAAAFGTGLLAACPIVWLTIFATVFSFATQSNWQSALYTWSMPTTQLAAAFCVVRVSRRHLGWLSVLNVCVAFFCFLSWSLNWYPGVTMPVLFGVNACTLMPWLLVSYDVIYLCPKIYRKSFHLGFLAAVTLQYCMSHFELYLTNVMYVPLCVFLTLGYTAFTYVSSHDVYRSGKARCKPIFTTNKKSYIVYTAWQVLDSGLMPLVLSWSITLALATACTALSLLTDTFVGIRTYMYIFYVGNYCCGELLMKKGYITAALYTVAFSGLAVLVLMGTHLMGKAGAVSCTALMFIFYFHANGSLLNVMRQRLRRGITTPRLILNLCMLSNAMIQFCFLITNKLTG